ncbi:hypothetical protein I7I51_03070 [Histoplasma capsulatum]|uniref:ER membrane protein complex subunit 10 n=1 Tax=Ajellomyces capsulatus TaxID=5037 RepID=A0A8A1MJT9_AJECA|nr:predicted protein [Histoplasma mississippiense (nom. inval.)]EDN11226.1 predicted protein [Histoplasma mississippiense (nom. inval.)]QSS66858.1 hypothetical protein I7I51_03070 [Histoplasma capsulatum]
MRLAFLSLLSLSVSAFTSASAPPLSADIFYWPLSSSTSKRIRLAKISYDPSTLTHTIDSYTPPQPQNVASNNVDAQADLVRIGLYTNPNLSDTESSSGSSSQKKQWVGTISSLSLFANTPQTLTLHLDQNNHVYHAAISSLVSPSPLSSSPDSRATRIKTPSPPSPPHRNSKGAGTEAGSLKVELIRSNPSPSPHLNRAVVRSPDGTVPEAAIEKSFFQRYWWVLGIIGILAFTGSADGS